MASSNETPRTSFVKGAREQLSRLNPSQTGKDLVLEYAKARESGNIEDMNEFILQTAKHMEMKDEYILRYVKTSEEVKKETHSENDRISAMVKEYKESTKDKDKVPCILSYNKRDMELLAKELNRQGHDVGFKKI